MRSSTTRRRTALYLTVGLALTAALAGCSSSSGSSGSNTTARDAAPAAAPPQQENNDALKAAPGAAPAQGGGGAAAGKPDLPAGSGQRSIVYTGSITVRVKDVTAQASELTSLAIGAGGIVSGDERQMDSGHSTATITVRVPAAQFTDVLNRIGKLGDEQTRKVSTEDVTAQVIDLDARIQSQQASVDRVRALLARAQSIGDITAIESELAKRESDLESMQAQQRNLADLTALSTIAVSLLGPDAAAPPAPKPAETGFWAGLKAGWKAFTASVGVVLTILGAVLPFAIAIGVPVWLVVWYLRRRSRRVPVVTQPPAPVGPPLSSSTVPPNPGSAM